MSNIFNSYDQSIDPSYKQNPINNNYNIQTKQVEKSEQPKKIRSGLFSKSLLEETAFILPRIPEEEKDIKKIKKFIRENLRFNAEYSRIRYTRYITYRIFSSNSSNPEVRAFARKFSGHQELKDVIFYHFLKAEPLMTQIIIDLFLPEVSSGSIRRSVVKEYLNEKFPDMKSTRDCAIAVADVLKETGIATTTQKTISFNYRSPLLSSFSYILHSEFPQRGIYSLENLETNKFFKAMFWYPEAILPMLYELRNQGIISRVSEIDTVRQFSTKYTLEEYVAQVKG